MFIIYAFIIIVGILWAGMIAQIAPEGSAGTKFVWIVGVLPVALCLLFVAML